MAKAPISWEEIYRMVHLLANLLAMVFNGLLLFVICWRTPKRLKNYSFLILYFTLCDLACAFFDSLILDRLIPYPNYIVAAPYGWCSYAGTFTCSLMHAAVLHCHTHSLTLLTISFWYRSRALLHPPQPRDVLRRLVVGYLPSFALMIFWALSYSPASKNLLAGTGYNLAELPELYSIGPITGPMILYLLSYIVLVTTGSYTIIAVYSRNINRSLRSCGSQLSKKMHRQLATTLRFQALTPFFAAIGTSCYFISMFMYPEPSPYLEMGVLFFPAFSPMCNPLLTLYFVIPYRKAVREMFDTIRKKQIKPASFAIYTLNDATSHQSTHRF